jgi:prevent-host-death family protein
MPPTMETIAISRFKATCLAVLERVRATGQPVLVTRFGQPIAEVVPPAPPAPDASWLGALRGRGRIAGDVTAPAGSLDAGAGAGAGG